MARKPSPEKSRRTERRRLTLAAQAIERMRQIERAQLAENLSLVIVHAALAVNAANASTPRDDAFLDASMHEMRLAVLKAIELHNIISEDF
jgi:hypothetical protein